MPCWPASVTVQTGDSALWLSHHKCKYTKILWKNGNTSFHRLRSWPFPGTTNKTLPSALELVQDSRQGLHTSATTYQLCDSNKSLGSFVSLSSKQGQQQYLELSADMPLWLSHVIVSNYQQFAASHLPFSILESIFFLSRRHDYRILMIRTTNRVTFQVKLCYVATGSGASPYHYRVYSMLTVVLLPGIYPGYFLPSIIWLLAYHLSVHSYTHPCVS